MYNFIRIYEYNIKTNLRCICMNNKLIKNLKIFKAFKCNKRNSFCLCLSTILRDKVRVIKFEYREIK